MSDAIVLRATGDVDQLRLERVEVPAPGPGELVIRHAAIGVNFHDTYVRSGQAQTLKLPGIPGAEAMGVVEEAGPDAAGFVPGDRVAYVDAAYGGYSQRRILPARLAVRVPEGVSDETAAAVTLKGLTACMLLTRVHSVGPGDTLLIHAAAGGTGQLLVRWAKHLGARVIATVGSDRKAEIARECGADEIILYRQESFQERVMALTAGKGVNVVYDSVGADTFQGSIDSLAYFGKLVNFGQSSGPVAPFSVARLSARSASVVRPYLFHYLQERPALEAMAAETFAALSAGVIRAEIGLRLPLARAADAHRAIESRQTSGAIVLDPS